MNFIKQFIRDEEGVTAIEYGLLAAIMAVLVVAIGAGLSDSLVAKFNEAITELNTVVPAVTGVL